MKHVIIADDDPGIQDVLGIILKRSGYEATIYDSATALLNDEFEEPDIFIIDKQLHNVDGLDVCRHLKSRENVQTPVIIFSLMTRSMNWPGRQVRMNSWKSLSLSKR